MTNQYSRNPEVTLKIYFDEVLILDKECLVGDSHFFYRYYYDTTGIHKISAIADDGRKSEIVIDFDEYDFNYVGISYWGEGLMVDVFHEEVFYE